jgi:hypothetical protein
MDLNAYLNFLIAHKLYELAYYTWLQFLPADELARVGLLANGGFEAASNGLPFDWSISVGSGATVEVSARPDAPGQHALLLELGPGRVEFPGVTQMLLLTPGAYHLKGQLKGELEGRRGLQWRVVCAAGQPLGESEMFVGERPIGRTSNSISRCRTMTAGLSTSGLHSRRDRPPSNSLAEPCGTTVCVSLAWG